MDDADGIEFIRPHRTQAAGLDDEPGREIRPNALADTGHLRPFFKVVKPGAAKIIGVCRPHNQRILVEEALFDDRVFHPFADEQEWEAAAWLAESGISDSHINKFFKLAYVRM